MHMHELVEDFGWVEIASARAYLHLARRDQSVGTAFLTTHSGRLPNVYPCCVDADSKSEDVHSAGFIYWTCILYDGSVALVNRAVSSTGQLASPALHACALHVMTHLQIPVAPGQGRQVPIGLQSPAPCECML